MVNVHHDAVGPHNHLVAAGGTFEGIGLDRALTGHALPATVRKRAAQEQEAEPEHGDGMSALRRRRFLAIFSARAERRWAVPPSRANHGAVAATGAADGNGGSGGRGPRSGPSASGPVAFENRTNSSTGSSSAGKTMK